VEFLIYELAARAIHLGERAKGNLFKPCLQTIPYSAITGALNRRFGRLENDGIKAVGYLEELVGRNRVELLTYSPRDRVLEISKIPLQVELLSDVFGTVVVVANEVTAQFPERFQIALGGMRSHGFGAAEIKLREKRPAGNPRLGLLRVRLPEREASAFGIVKVIAPRYGYLFRPDPDTHSGVYVRALFESSRVVGPESILQPQKR
jgi:hypothetical protein